MYIIVWKYEVRTEQITEFEAIYGSRGPWAELFAKSPGYLGTTLSRETESPLVYITFDYWQAEEDFRQFGVAFADAYTELEMQCGRLILRQRRLGSFMMGNGKSPDFF